MILSYSFLLLTAHVFQSFLTDLHLAIVHHVLLDISLARSYGIVRWPRVHRLRLFRDQFSQILFFIIMHLYSISLLNLYFSERIWAGKSTNVRGRIAKITRDEPK